MATQSLQQTKQCLKEGKKTPTHLLINKIKQLHHLKLWIQSYLFFPLHVIHKSIKILIGNTLKLVYRTPLFKSQCQCSAKGLNLYGGLHYVTAESVVTHDIPAFCQAGGAPAKIIKCLKPSGDNHVE